AQKPHHELRCLARAWISERLLGIGKPVVAADPGRDKRGKKQRRTRGIHLAEADRLDEAAGVVERTNWLIIDAPLFPPKLLQLLLSHDLLTIRTQVEKLRMKVNRGHGHVLGLSGLVWVRRFLRVSKSA